MKNLHDPLNRLQQMESFPGTQLASDMNGSIVVNPILCNFFTIHERYGLTPFYFTGRVAQWKKVSNK